MNGLFQKHLIGVVAATFMFGDVMAADTESEEPAEQHNKMTTRDQLSTENESDGIESRDSKLIHEERAVSETDFKALSSSEPGVEVGRVNIVKPVEGGAKPEATDPAETRVPETLRHRDRAATTENEKAKEKEKP